MISVVTPSLRQLDWLKLCVASVADQAGVEVEHIVQDAGSDPELENWARQQSSIRFFVEQDEGMYDAINRGLTKARGDICAYLNCDEQYLPGALAKVADFFAAHPEIEVLFGDFVLTDTSGHPLSYRRVVLPTLQHLRVAPLGPGTCATFFRRRLLDRNFYFDPKWKASGDAVWVERLLKARVSMAVTPQPLAIFTITNQNLGASSLSRQEGSRRRDQDSGAIERGRLLTMYRLRKLLAGAYWPKRVAIDIYTRESPLARRRFVEKHLGFRWHQSDRASSR